MTGTFWNANDMAVHMAGIMIFLFAFFPSIGRNVWLKLFYAICILSTLMAILLSLSRSGMIAVGLATVLFMLSRRHRKQALALIVLGLGGLIYLLLLSPYKLDLLERFASFTMLDQDRSGQVRLRLLTSGLYILTDGLQVLWGAGYNSFTVMVERYVHPLMSHDGYYHVGIRGAHNLWIAILAELGLIGAIAIVYFFRTIFRQISLCLRESLTPAQASILLGALVYVAVKIVGFNFNQEFEEGFFWFAMGILGSKAIFVRPRGESEGQPA